MKRKPQTIKVARFEFPESGYGIHIGMRNIDNPSPKLMDAVNPMDTGMKPPVREYAKFGKILTGTKEVKTLTGTRRSYTNEPMEYAELVKDEAGQTIGSHNVNFAFTMKEYKKRLKSGQVKKALNVSKAEGHPLQVKILEIPKSSIIYGDNQQIGYDKRITRTVSKRTGRKVKNNG